MLDNVDTYPRPTEERDLKDLAALALGRMRLTRCPGGRYTDKQFPETHCAHCGVDFTDRANLNFCGQPLDADGLTPFDATVAMRIMRESEDQFGAEA